MREQGVMIDCVYCKYIRPELKGTNKCPKCRGLTPIFREAQMMSKELSLNTILHKILMLEHIDDLERLKDDFYELLESIDIYNFDLKDALINSIREIEDGSGF